MMWAVTLTIAAIALFAVRQRQLRRLSRLNHRANVVTLTARPAWQ